MCGSIKPGAYEPPKGMKPKGSLSKASCVFCFSLSLSFFLVCLSLSGMFAIRGERDYVVSEDFMKVVRKVSENKKLETKPDYKQIVG